MTAEEIDLLGNIFGGTETLTPEDINDYFDVIKAAYDVHVDREKIRNGLWKDYPAEDQANQIKAKIDRVLRSLERLKVTPPTTPFAEQEVTLKDNIAEELCDIINYANFTYRIVKGSVT